MIGRSVPSGWDSKPCRTLCLAHWYTPTCESHMHKVTLRSYSKKAQFSDDAKLENHYNYVVKKKN